MSDLQNKLTGALIGLARATDGNEHLISDSSTAVILESLAALQKDSGQAALENLLEKVYDEKRKMVPDCFTCAAPCGKNSDYNMETLHTAQEDIRSLKRRILSGICEMALHAVQSGYHDETAERFFYKALIVIGMDGYTAEDLHPILKEMENKYQKCMTMPH